MNNPRNALNSSTLSELKSQIAIKLCFPISGKPDCFKLSEVLSKENYGNVSATTLYRLLVNFKGIIPYQNTLDILAKYIGFLSWLDFVEKTEVKNYNYTINQQDLITNSLIYHCIQSGDTKSLTPFFESIVDFEYKFKVKVALDVYDSLLKTEKPELFFSKYRTNKFVKEFVLEDAFDPTFRIKNYDFAYKLYGNEFKKVKSVDALQDYVFSQSVLFRYYFLSGKKEEAFTIGKKIYQETPIPPSDLDTIYLFPNIRYRAYKIWFNQLLGDKKSSKEAYIIEILDYCQHIYDSLDVYGRKVVFHCVAEVFCYAKIDLKYHLILKSLFKEEFLNIPHFLFEKPLQKSLPYFEANGLLHYRPVL